MTGHTEVGLFGINLTGKAQPVLLKNSPRSRPQRRNADYTLTWTLSERPTPANWST
jgi:hypothetical protein